MIERFDPRKKTRLYRAYQNIVAPEYKEVGLVKVYSPIMKAATAALLESGREGEAILAELQDLHSNPKVYSHAHFFLQLYDLLAAAQERSGQQFVFTPDAFVEGLQGYVETQMNMLPTPKRKAYEPFGGMGQDLVRDLDTIASQPSAYENFLNTGHCSPESLYGYIRSQPQCSAFVEAFFANVHPDFRVQHLVGVGGLLNPHIGMHSLAGFVESQKRKQRLLELATAAPFDDILSPENPDVRDVLDVVLIDFSFLQIFKEIPFLKMMPYHERIEFMKRHFPDVITDSGLFVGSFYQYIHMSFHFGNFWPSFQVDDAS